MPYPSSESGLWRWLVPLLQPVNWVLLRGFFDIRIVGQERLDWSLPGLVLAPKHSSRWDPLLLSLLTPRLLRFVATQSEFKGIQGWWMRRLGAIPLDRESAHASTFRRLETLLLAGEILVMFPEGGIRPGRVGCLKPGLGRLVMRMERRYQLSMTVVPVAIAYSPSACLRARVRIEVLPPFYGPWIGKEVPGCADKVLAQQLTQRLAESLAEALELPQENTSPTQRQLPPQGHGA